MNSSPERRDRLSFDAIRVTLDSLHSKNPLRVVIFAGGEPTLLGETLLEAIAYADGLGLITRLVTNAAWATSVERASAKVTELRLAGLAELNISADDYHTPYIPFQNVVNAWRAAKGRGFAAVVIANCYGPRSRVTPDYIEQQLGESLPVRFDSSGQTQALPERSADGTVYILSNSYLQRLGRARDVTQPAQLFWPTTEDSLNGGCPWAVRSAALSPRGHLVACCGIEAEGNAVLDFGAVGDDDPQSLVERADQSVIVNAIALLGPIYVARFIRERAPELGLRDHATVCEACESVVRNPSALDVLNQHLPSLTAAVAAARAAAYGGRGL